MTAFSPRPSCPLPGPMGASASGVQAEDVLPDGVGFGILEYAMAHAPSDEPAGRIALLRKKNAPATRVQIGYALSDAADLAEPSGPETRTTQARRRENRELF
jgi:hypothetical protein